MLALNGSALITAELVGPQQFDINIISGHSYKEQHIKISVKSVKRFKSYESFKFKKRVALCGLCKRPKGPVKTFFANILGVDNDQ